MVLYVDVLFAINFSMDFLALFITSRILHKLLYKIRILIAAILGGAYSIFEMLVPIESFAISLLINVSVSVLMCLIAYKNNKVSKFLITVAMFWGTSTLMGGAMSLIFSAFNKIFYEYLIKNEIINSSSYNGTRFFIVMLLGIVASVLFSRLYATKKDIKEAVLEISLRETTFILNGLCDSGNLIKEPFSGKSVILIPKRSALGTLIEATDEYKRRYIPYSALGSSGILKGVIPNKIKVNDNETDAIIATVERNDFSGYEALVPVDLL